MPGPDSGADPDPNTDPDSDSNPDPDPDTDTDPNTNSDTDPDPDSNTDPDTDPAPNAPAGAGADADPHEALHPDPDLGPLVEAHGPLSLAPAEDPFRRLVVAIVRQQVSTDAAAAIRERLFERVTVTPEALATADPSTLRDAGLSEQKAGYVQNAARAFREAGYSRDDFAGMADDAVREELTAITGVGDWTADMFLLFCLGREDVFPVGDLGVRKAMRAVVDPDLDREEMVAHAERWRPHRSYATLYLWRAVD